jgi:hypothetical protein
MTPEVPTKQGVTTIFQTPEATYVTAVLDSKTLSMAELLGSGNFENNNNWRYRRGRVYIGVYFFERTTENGKQNNPATDIQRPNIPAPPRAKIFHNRREKITP